MAARRYLSFSAEMFVTINSLEVHPHLRIFKKFVGPIAPEQVGRLSTPMNLVLAMANGVLAPRRITSRGGASQDSLRLAF
jgi:hypothetical protein